jgi:predicted ATPase
LPSPQERREEIKLRVAFANALALTGDFVDGKEHYDRALAIYDPAEHRPIATRSGRDVGVTLLSFRSACLWLLGYPAASRNDGERAVKNARETGQATTLMYAMWFAIDGHALCGNYGAANAQVDEFIALADETGSPYWKASGTAVRGWVFALTGRASDAVRAITSGIASLRSTGASLYEPAHLRHLAMHRVAGEIALKSLAPDQEKAEAYFDRALAVARQQRAKSWELRAAMSIARLWSGQGKRDEAFDLLAPVYGWFAEGFHTCDLKEAKALLDELA